MILESLRVSFILDVSIAFDGALRLTVEGGLAVGDSGIGGSAALGKQCCSKVITCGGVFTRTSLRVKVLPRTEFSKTISLGGARVPKKVTFTILV